MNNVIPFERLIEARTEKRLNDLLNGTISELEDLNNIHTACERSGATARDHRVVDTVRITAGLIDPEDE